MKVSVLINSYNHARWLRCCIDSVLTQDPPPGEIILYDDGSTDDTVAIARSYGPRVTVIAGLHQRRAKRVNHGEAIHAAFQHSSGDVVFLLDGDDGFTPGKIAHYLAAFAASPQPVLVQAPLHLVDDRHRALPRFADRRKHSANPFESAYARADTDLFYPTSALAFTRTFLARQLPLQWDDGVDAWSDQRLCIAALFAGPVRTLEEEHGFWRRHAQSDSARIAGGRSYLLNQARIRNRLFNHHATSAGRPTLSLWKNPRFYGHVLRLFSPALAGLLRARFFTRV